MWAFCQCGWTGPRRRCWDADATPGERADLAGHLSDSGHQLFPDGVPCPEGWHRACGHFHGFDDWCPAPPDSPLGMIRRIVGRPTICDPEVAVDRLAAIDALRKWLEGQESEAGLGARLAGCTWGQMGAAVGVDASAARGRWGKLTASFEAAGILPVDPGEPAQLRLPA